MNKELLCTALAKAFVKIPSNWIDYFVYEPKKNEIWVRSIEDMENSWKPAASYSFVEAPALLSLVIHSFNQGLKNQ